MFRTVITDTAFTTPAADMALSRISVTSYRGDTSFAATARALLGKRMPPDKGLSVSHTSLGRTTPRGIVDEIGIGTDTVRLISVSMEDADWDALPGVVADGFPGFCRIEKMTLFFKDICKVHLYIHEELRSALVIVERMDMVRWRAMQIALPVILPWYFAGDACLSPGAKEHELLCAIKDDDTPDRYLSLLQELAEPYDFRETAIRRLLSGFESSGKERRIAGLQNQISNIEYEMQDLMRRYRDYMRNKEEKNVLMTGLKIAAERQENNVLLDYFLINRNLDLVSANDGELRFIVRTPLAYWSPDAAEINIDNAYSALYDECGEPDAKLFYRALFLDESIRLHLCAAYKIDLCDGMWPLQGYDFPADILRMGFPNTHIQHYECSGDYVAAANEAVNAGNYIGAVEQCVASAANLNINDSCVMRTFGHDLFRSDAKCVELPDGSRVTPREAIEYLKN